MPWGTRRWELPHQDENVHSSSHPQVPLPLLSSLHQQQLSNLFLLPDPEVLAKNFHKPRSGPAPCTYNSLPHAVCFQVNTVFSVPGQNPFCVNGDKICRCYIISLQKKTNVSMCFYFIILFAFPCPSCVLLLLFVLLSSFLSCCSLPSLLRVGLAQERLRAERSSGNDRSPSGTAHPAESRWKPDSKSAVVSTEQHETGQSSQWPSLNSYESQRQVSMLKNSCIHLANVCFVPTCGLAVPALRILERTEQTSGPSHARIICS